MLFIGTKHSGQTFRVIPFIKTALEQQLNGEKRDGKLIHLSFFGLSWVVFLSSAWKNVGILTRSLTSLLIVMAMSLFSLVMPSLTFVVSPPCVASALLVNRKLKNF